jgi:ketosteroid isomerase-like protein
MMHRCVPLILAFAFTLCCCSRSTHSSADSNKALLRHAVDVWAAGDMSALEQVVAPGYIGHTSKGDRDIEGLRQRIQAFHKLYSSISFHVEDQMADGNKVVTRLTADVTMRDTGKSARLMGINISRIADGKIVEEWNTWEPVTAGEPKNEPH